MQRRNEINNEINSIMKDLRKAGVKSLKFLNRRVAVDQMGRKIVFKRTITNGILHTTFEIIN